MVWASVDDDTSALPEQSNRGGRGMMVVGTDAGRARRYDAAEARTRPSKEYDALQNPSGVLAWLRKTGEMEAVV